MTFLRTRTTELLPRLARLPGKSGILPGSRLALPAGGMGTRARIAVATRSRSERAAIGAWLDSADFQAVHVTDIGAPARELEALKFELLIVDTEMMTLGSLMHVARYRAT